MLLYQSLAPSIIAHENRLLSLGGTYRLHLEIKLCFVYDPQNSIALYGTLISKRAPL